MHKSRDIYFTLIVDDFGVKTINKEDANYLIETLEKYCAIEVDWSGSKYCGITLQWCYKNRCLDKSMSENVKSIIYDHAPDLEKKKI